MTAPIHPADLSTTTRHTRRAEHLPPVLCFAVIPLVQIYLFTFRSRGKASLPWFSQIRCEWAVQMHNTGGELSADHG